MPVKKGELRMKKIIGFLICFFGLFVFTSCENKVDPLDEITNYEITVAPQTDGTLNMVYSLKWKVLNDTEEGPLSWVKIGVPNRYVDQLNATSKDIKNISYYSDGGAYIRLDLIRDFHAGEIVDLTFSFHQSRIFSKMDDLITFAFIPGWFDEIKINYLKVLWSSENVLQTNSDSLDNGYYVWEQRNLNFGETISVELTYNPSAFPQIDLNMGYSDDFREPTPTWLITGIIVLVVIIVILAIIAMILSRDNYYTYRGFSGRRIHYSWFFFHRRGVGKNGEGLSRPKIVNGRGSGSSGGGFSCACACACAGGGRAGCSRKDFYFNSELNESDKTVKKEKK